MSTLHCGIQNMARNEHGELSVVLADGAIHTQVVPVRAHPLSAPNEGISLMSPDGHEIAWIDHLHDLPTDMQAMVQADLAARELMPEIQAIESVSGFATPCTWHVQTDRGLTDFVLKSEDAIRRLADGRLLIQSANGLQFMITHRDKLSKTSLALLNRFL